MKSDHTTHLLLGIIATGVTVLAALAFERRYYVPVHNALDKAGDKLDGAIQGAREKTHQATNHVREKVSHLSDRVEEGVDSLKSQVSDLKDRVAGSADSNTEEFRTPGQQA